MYYCCVLDVCIYVSSLHSMCSIYVRCLYTCLYSCIAFLTSHNGVVFYLVLIIVFSTPVYSYMCVSIIYTIDTW